MKNKDRIMLGIIIGIALFFVGGMINSTFESSEDNLLPYKISSTLKLVGMGILVATLIIGGIIGYELNKNFRILILIVGLSLLLVFTIGAQLMKWDTSTQNSSFLAGESSMNSSSEESNAYENRPSTPGFELFVAIIAIVSLLFFKKIKGKIT